MKKPLRRPISLNGIGMKKPDIVFQAVVAGLLACVMPEPANPNYAAEVARDFARQGIMQNMGAYLISVTPGQVEIGVNFRHDLTQQHGYLHAGIITTIVDSACGFAAYTLMPPGSGVLTVEYKVNFMAPASGEKIHRLRARHQVRQNLVGLPRRSLCGAKRRAQNHRGHTGYDDENG